MKRGCVRDGLAQFDIKQYLGMLLHIPVALLSEQGGSKSLMCPPE